MSTIKLNIQLFGGGADWTQGVTKSALEDAFENFKKDCDAAKDAVMDYGKVDSALTAGWSGQDCQMYLEKFHTHATNVCNEIDTYVVAVRGTVDSIVSQWESFQAGLIS